MRRWETLAALLAVTLASLSAVNLGGRPRPVLAFAAIALLIVVGYTRLRSLRSSNKQPKFDAYERALQIQEERERKFR